jgi:hypothetical protein
MLRLNRLSNAARANYVQCLQPMASAAYSCIPKLRLSSCGRCRQPADISTVRRREQQPRRRVPGIPAFSEEFSSSPLGPPAVGGCAASISEDWLDRDIQRTRDVKPAKSAAAYVQRLAMLVNRRSSLQKRRKAFYGFARRRSRRAHVMIGS